MNNQITHLKSQVSTMSSTEIAQLAGKQKTHIHRDIKEQLLLGLYGLKDDPNLDDSKIQGITVVLDNRGYWSEVLLDHEHTLTLMTGYDVKARHTINKRRLELETKTHAALPNFNNPVEAARAWADEAEQKQLAQLERDQAFLQIEAQKETIQTKDDLIRVSNEASVKAGEILIREFVKSQDLITLGEKQFFAWMRGQKIVFSDRNEPYQHYVKAGYFTYKPSEELYGGKFRYTMRVTPRGKAWLAAKYMAYLDAAGVIALDETPQPRNGLVLLQGAQA